VKLFRNILFSTGRYPSMMGARGQQDVEFCRYLEWMWLKRCLMLIGAVAGAAAIGTYIGMFYADEIAESAFWVWGVAWLYNGLILMVLIVSAALGAIKALMVKAFLSPEIQVSQAAMRTGQMMKKGGI
jgi:hypothetical protein|tara:strand:+ start:1316 stop:1699 length:384 start_codon:yes stop_codon:yes gene_type:complete